MRHRVPVAPPHPGRAHLIHAAAPQTPTNKSAPSTKCAECRYQILGEVGQGTYGVVFRARDSRIPPLSPAARDNVEDTGVVALKRMRLDAQDEGVPVTTLREVALLQDLIHPHIVRLREVRGRQYTHRHRAAREWGKGLVGGGG